MSTNVEGITETLATMRASGSLEQVDAALVALAEGLAKAVDDDPGNAALWREYRAAVIELRRAGSGGVDDDTASFLAIVRTPVVRAALGDGSH